MFAIIKKEFLHIIRDVRTLMVLLGMPIILMLLFGYAISNELNNIEISFYDQANNELSLLFKQKVKASRYFSVQPPIEHEEQITSLFRKGKTNAVAIIHHDFNQRVKNSDHAAVEFIVDASDPNTASLISTYFNITLLSFMKEQVGGRIQQGATIDIASRMLYNPELKSVYMFVPGILTVILMLITTLLTSITIAREKELGSMEILLTTPVKPHQVLIGKVIPYMVVAFIINILILLVSKYVFQMHIAGSIPLLLATSLLFILLSLSLGLLISIVTDSQQAAMIISLAGLLLPTILLSGFIFPIANMPYILQLISHLVPTKWFIIILKNVMLKGVGFSYIWKEVVILTGMTLFLLLLCRKKFNVRLK